MLKWFHADGEAHVPAARLLRAEFEAGQIVNVAARRWHWHRAELVELADALVALKFEHREPEITAVAEWIALGLTAYDKRILTIAAASATALSTLSA